MSQPPLRVGIVGLQPGRSWAARAHIPALLSLSEEFEVAGVANSSRASAEAAAEACHIAHAFDSVADLVNSPDIDIVTVTVKVPHHLEIVRAAIKARKHVYCEWPLGNGLAEAEEMTSLLKEGGVLGVVGNQARVAPEILYLRQLLADGFAGEILSTTIMANAGSWGSFLDSQATRAYMLDRANGATMLTIPFAHMLAAVQDVLGNFSELSAFVATRRHSVLALDTGNILPVTAPDQVLVSGLLASGAPISIHYRGGESRAGMGFVWEINGADGDLRVTARNGGIQLVELSLEGGRGQEKTMAPLHVPEAFRTGYPEAVVTGNVARIYARLAADLRGGTRTAPSFDDAVELHKLLATIEAAAGNGARLKVGACNRPLPLAV